MISDNIPTPWSKLNARDFDSWHSMCSYLGAFPPPLANYFIQYFSNEGDLVYDPFSGRGTTILEARILNRNSLGTDLNPIALALSEAKNFNLSREDIYSRIDELEVKYDYALYQPEALAQSDEIHLIFHPKTLSQLCYLRRKLLRSDKQVDKYLIGITLGILHGGERKDTTSAYASIDMPNTFSMSPEYVRRYVQTNQLNRIERNIFNLLKEKTDRIYKKHTILGGKGLILKANVKSLSKYQELEKYKNTANLILTSPPYLGIVNYAKQNWIRSWFMNQDPLAVSKELDDDLNLDEWINFSKLAIIELKQFLKEDGVAVFVIGDVAKSKNSVIPLAREFCLMINENKFFKNVWCINDVITSSDKTTRIWGDKKGIATTTDRIVILSNIDPFEKFKNKNQIEKLNLESVEEITKYFIGN